MKSCVFPGSFDPVTRGHLDLIVRAARLFDRVTVVVMINRNKRETLSPEARVRLLKACCSNIPGVFVERWDGLLADYMRRKDEICVLRGARDAAECGQELISAAANRQMNPEMETVLLPATEGLHCLSSSMVREISSFGGDVRPFLPEAVAEEIVSLLSNRIEGNID